MELTLKTEALPGWQAVYAGTLSREELNEAALPDSLPDVARVLEVECRVFAECQPSADRLEFTGQIRAEVLYQPEGESGVRSVEMTVPVQFIQEAQGVLPRSVVHLRTLTPSGDARVLNPRKLLLRVGLLAEVRVYAPAALEQGGVVEQAEEWQIQLRRESRSTQIIRAVPRKSFGFADRITLPGVAGPIARVMKCRPRCGVTECRVVGSKVLMKGSVALEVFFRDEDGAPQSARTDLPFSQILDGGGASEGAWAEGWVELTACTCHPAAGAGQMDVTMEFVAQAELRETAAAELVTDGYSTRCPMEFAAAAVPCVTQLGEDTCRRPAAQTVECGVGIRRVCDKWASVSGGDCRWEDGHRIIGADVTVHLCVEEESGRINGISRSWPMSVQIPAKAEDAVIWHCEAEELSAVPSEAGVEVKFTFAAHYVRRHCESVDTIRSLTLHPEDEEAQRRPGLLLRRVQAGEDLWEIAKCCHSTESDICAVNGLDEGEPQPGAFLLIPRKR